MSDPEDFAAMFARESARPTLEVGQVVKGRVIHIDAENVFVDVGGKGEAWIERAELLDPEGKLHDIPAAFDGDLDPAGWSKSGKVLGMGYALRSELWQMRLPQAGCRSLPPAQ